MFRKISASWYSTVMDQLESASTQSEQEQKRQPPNADSTEETMPTCNDRMWTTPITTWAQTAFKIQRLRHVQNCSVQRLRQIETVLIELVFFVFYCFFCFLVFFKRGRVLHNYASRASLNQHVITILSHGPLYTLHLVHIKRFQRIKYLV